MRSTILTLATCIVVCGCATQPAVDVDYDTTKDFSTLKTYQWMPATGNAASAGAAGTSGMAGPASTAGGMAAPGSAAGPSASFDELAGSKGYITQQDARHDAWLSGHFSGCDSNHDGKLTRQEYAQCTQQAGTGTPQGMPPACRCRDTR